MRRPTLLCAALLLLAAAAHAAPSAPGFHVTTLDGRRFDSREMLGKMAAGIRVVPASTDAPLDLGRAFLRTLMWVLLAVPAGLGFLSAIASRDRRGWHDRFAGTRVVRASL